MSNAAAASGGKGRNDGRMPRRGLEAARDTALAACPVTTTTSTSCWLQQWHQARARCQPAAAPGRSNHCSWQARSSCSPANTQPDAPPPCHTSSSTAAAASPRRQDRQTARRRLNKNGGHLHWCVWAHHRAPAMQPHRQAAAHTAAAARRAACAAGGGHGPTPSPQHSSLRGASFCSVCLSASIARLPPPAGSSRTPWACRPHQV